MLDRRPAEGGCVRAEIEDVTRLRFDSGAPVRAASAIAPLGDGWLVAQDDGTHAAWQRGPSVTPLRVLPPIEGLDDFSEAAGTKHLKPDFEAACELLVDGLPGVLLLGSGSSPRRMRASLVLLDAAGPRFHAVDLTPLYTAVAAALGVAAPELNLEGACRSGDRMRWFQRGNLRTGTASASVDLAFADLLAALLGAAPAQAVGVGHRRGYDLGEESGVGLAVTDAVALPDGRVLVSAAAEDTANPIDDGPVVGAAIALLDGDEVVDVAPLRAPDGAPVKVEGLALREADERGARLLAVVDADDPTAPSALLAVRVRWR
jgi:hypothetical protein